MIEEMENCNDGIREPSLENRCEENNSLSSLPNVGNFAQALSSMYKRKSEQTIDDKSRNVHEFLDVVPPDTSKSSFIPTKPSRKLTARGHTFGLLDELNSIVVDGLKKLKNSPNGLVKNLNLKNHDAVITSDRHLKSKKLEKRVIKSSAVSEVGDDNPATVTLDPEIKDIIDRVEVYQTAFARFIEEIGRYKPILTTIKEEYDGAIKCMVNVVQDTFVFRREKAELLNKHNEEIKQIRLEHRKKIQDWSEQVKDFKDQIAVLDTANKDHVQEIGRCKNMIEKYKKDYEDSRKSNVTLTSALSRFDDERRKLQMRQATIEENEVAVKASEQRLLAEVQRLLKVIEEMEEHQSALVSAAIVERQLEVISELQNKLEEINNRHHQLVCRYISLKNLLSEDMAGEEKVNDLARIDFLKDDQTIEDLKEKGLASNRQVIEQLLSKLQDMQKKIDNLKLTDSSSLPQRVNDIPSEDRDDFSAWSYLPSYGDAMDIAPYLRTSLDTKIRNLRLTDAEIEAMISDMWKVRLTYTPPVEEKALLTEVDEALHTDKTTHVLSYHQSRIQKLRSNSKRGVTHRSTTKSIRGLMSDSSFKSKVSLGSKNFMSSAMFSDHPTQLSGHGTDHGILSAESMDYNCNPFEHFLTYYLELRFQSEIKRIEVIYNLLYYCNLYSSTNSTCKLFLMILKDEIPEETRIDIDGPLHVLKEACLEEDKRRNMLTVHDPYCLPYDSMVSVLKRIFNKKTSSSIQDLLQAFEKDVEDKTVPVNYIELLATTKEDVVYPEHSSNNGKMSEILTQKNKKNHNQPHKRSRINDILRMQYINDFKLKEEEVLKCIYSVLKKDPEMMSRDVSRATTLLDDTLASQSFLRMNSKAITNNECLPSTMTIRHLREALILYDPHRARPEMTKYLALCYNVSIEELLVIEGKRIEVSVQDFVRRFRRNLLKSSKPVDGSSSISQEGKGDALTNIASESNVSINENNPVKTVSIDAES